MNSVKRLTVNVWYLFCTLNHTSFDCAIELGSVLSSVVCFVRNSFFDYHGSYREQSVDGDKREDEEAILFGGCSDRKISPANFVTALVIIYVFIHYNHGSIKKETDG